MKRTITKRSTEELEKFFKKSRNRAIIDNLNVAKTDKTQVPLHQIIENAVIKFEHVVPFEVKPEDEELNLDLDELPLDFEEEE